MTDLIYQKNALRECGQSTDEVDAIIQDMLTSQSIEKFYLCVQELEILGAKLDWPRDRDYVAVALQFAAEGVMSDSVRVAMIEYAINRATYCASCCTSGGEGLARAEHIHELKKILQS